VIALADANELLLDDQLRGTDFCAPVLDPAGRPVGTAEPLLTTAEHPALNE
jgi:hypothetical protein